MGKFSSLKRQLFEVSLHLHRFIADRWGYDLPLVKRNCYKLDTTETRQAVLELCAQEAYRNDVQGSVAELGVFRGDFARWINHYFPDRPFYLFDTFEGFDERDASVELDRGFSTGKQGHDFSKTSEALVLDKMEYRKNCIVKKGYFPDTATDVSDTFCFVSIDADLYQPILAGLNFFYPKLVGGGYIMVHDFNNDVYKGSRQAVLEFCKKHNVGYVPISDSFGSVVITK